MTVEIKNQCYTAFLRGASLASIAAEMGGKPSRRTLERWSKAEGWMAQRRQLFSERLEAEREKLLSGAPAKDQSMEGQLNQLIAEAVAQYQLFLRGKIPAKALPMPPEKMARVIHNLVRGRTGRVG